MADRAANTLTQYTIPHRQAGAVAIEIAPAFLLFFAIFYAIVSYSMAMVMKQALTQAAVEGARAAVKVDPLNFTSATSYETATRTVARARATEALSWLPADALATVLGGVAVSLTASGAVQVTITYNGYNVTPLLPVLDLPIIGKVPDLPDKLVGQAVAQPG